MYLPLGKQDKMLDLVLKYYRESLRALDKNIYLDELLKLEVRESIARAKYTEEANIDKIDKVSKEITRQIDELINSRGGGLDD